MTGGVTMPLPRNPTVYLQVPAPVKPTKPTLKDTTMTDGAPGPQNTANEDTGDTKVLYADQAQNDSPASGSAAPNEANVKITNVESNIGTGNDTLGPASTSKFAAAKIENDNTTAQVAANKINEGFLMSQRTTVASEAASVRSYVGGITKHAVDATTNMDVVIARVKPTTTGILVKPGQTISSGTVGIQHLSHPSNIAGIESSTKSFFRTKKNKMAGEVENTLKKFKSAVESVVSKRESRKPPAPVDKRPGVKNRHNVPTRDELLKSGLVDESIIDMMQVRIDVPPLELLENAGPIDTTVAQDPNPADTTHTAVTEPNVRSVTQLDPNAQPVGSDTLNANVPVKTTPASATDVPASVRGTAANTINSVTSNSAMDSPSTEPTQFPSPDPNPRENTISKPSSDTNETIATNSAVNETMRSNVNVTSQGVSSPITEEVATCPEISCNISCEHGYKIDVKGCQTCDCKCKYFNIRYP